ncbi:MAG: hypothetical protein LBQ42_13725, partial [Synergistaceae bacterium]|nr:hypothetical protein [Synergistaceae bacterium]
MGMIRKKRVERRGLEERAAALFSRREAATLAEIEKLEAASLRSLRTVTIKGKTKAPDDAQYLANYD